MAMSIFNRILFAGDLSGCSRDAFGAACALARGPGAYLHVLSVVEPVLLAGPPVPSRSPSLPSVLPPNTPAHRKEIEKRLHADYHADAPIAVDYLVRDGDASKEILRAADEVDADLIVVGTHGRSGVDRLVCGSVAESIMQRSSRPVMIVRSPAVSLQARPIRLILHPTDFSTRSWPALGVARALARANGAGIVLLHVAPAEVLTGGTFYAPADLGPEREALANLRDETAKAGFEGSVQTRFSQGDPVTEILLAAEELDCDLIVMGSHGRTGLRRLLMGSVAEYVIRKAPCLTLIVKDAPAEGGEAGKALAVAKDAGVCEVGQ
jgi:nucleotide-binding universal stress UspA family protein